MAKVFIINAGGHDYSQAKTFGELIIMTQGFINRFHLNWKFGTQVFPDAIEGRRNMTKAEAIVAALNAFEDALDARMGSKTNWGRKQILDIVRDVKFNVLSKLMQEGSR